MTFGLIALVAFVLFLLVVGVGLFVMLVGSKEKGTGSKIGIVIAIMGIGMTFLICVGVPLLFLGFKTVAEPPAFEMSPIVIEKKAAVRPVETDEDIKTESSNAKQFGEIPVHLKEKKENGNNNPVQTESENKTTTKENE